MRTASLELLIADIIGLPRKCFDEKNHEQMNLRRIPSLKFDIAPENRWLEDKPFLLGETVTFQG